jgi:DNA-binding NarL/FixJ family response regulator
MLSAASNTAEELVQRPRLLLADDHLLILEALKRTLENDFQIEMVTDSEAFLKAIDSFRPDIAVLDVSMPDADGFATAQKALERRPDLRIVFVSMHLETNYVEHAFQLGARGYLSKNTRANDLIAALHSVLNGNPSRPDSIVKDLKLRQRRQTGLTERQIEVLKLIADGASAKDVANTLNISVRTAEFHRAAIMERLKIHSSAQLTRFAIEHSLVVDSVIPLRSESLPNIGYLFGSTATPNQV